MWFLRKYDSTSGRTSVVDEDNDIFGLKAIRLNGVLFDPTNIGTQSQIEALETIANNLQTQLNSHELQNSIDIDAIRADVQALYDLIGLLSQEVSRFYLDEPIEERIVTTEGQTVLVASVVSWATSNAIQDVEVWRNGVRLYQDVTGGTDKDYRKLDSNRIEITRAARADDRFYFRMERRLRNSMPAPYFYQHTADYAGRGIPTPQRYVLNSDRLTVFKNGTLLVRGTTYGEAVNQYDESSPNFIALRESIAPGEVVSFLHQANSPAFRFAQTGITGAVITIPTYVVGDGRLKVWRNGVLMNNQGIGDATEQYSETSTTSITLADPAVADDWFVFENAYAPHAFRENITGVTGFVLTLSNSYTPGDDRLMVFRNGILMFKSVTLGDPVDRYSETSSTEITLEEVATSSEWFSVIYL